MKPPEDKPYQPVCPLCHRALDKLSAIIGYCDLLTQPTGVPGDSAKEVVMIRDIAQELAQELATFQCELLATERQGEVQDLLPNTV